MANLQSYLWGSLKIAICIVCASCNGLQAANAPLNAAPSPPQESSPDSLKGNSPSLSNLDGTWIAFESEPEAGMISRCKAYARYTLQLKQTNLSLTGQVRFSSYSTFEDVFHEDEDLSGFIEGDGLKLSGKTLGRNQLQFNYDLIFDRDRLQIIGVRNDKKIWLVRTYNETCSDYTPDLIVKPSP